MYCELWFQQVTERLIWEQFESRAALRGVAASFVLPGCRPLPALLPSGGVIPSPPVYMRGRAAPPSPQQGRLGLPETQQETCSPRSADTCLCSQTPLAVRQKTGLRCEKSTAFGKDRTRRMFHREMNGCWAFHISVCRHSNSTQ